MVESEVSSARALNDPLDCQQAVATLVKNSSLSNREEMMVQLQKASTPDPQQQQVQQNAPDLLGTLTGLLDSNKDGSIVDDVAGMLGKLFKGR